MANMKALSLAILLAAAPLTLGAQQNNTASALAGPVSASSAGAAHPSDDRPALQHRNPRYQVQRDDILNISFALSPELNQTVTIQPDGYINLLSAGSIYIQGMTVPEVVEALRTAYSRLSTIRLLTWTSKTSRSPTSSPWGKSASRASMISVTT